MNKPTVLFTKLQKATCFSFSRAVTTKSSKENTKNNGSNRRSARESLGRLQGIISTMKKEDTNGLERHFKKFGRSDLFNYATNPDFKQSELKRDDLKIWSRLRDYDLQATTKSLPINGFEELIQLTEQGKLWQFPIDNEQGMAEKGIPFEEHVFFDEKLEEFPQVEFIQSLMRHVTSGLARNPWMTVERKHEVIKFYKDYFDEKREIYKQSGVVI